MLKITSKPWVWLLVLLVSIGGYFAFQSVDQAESPKKIHNVLYDLYLPDTPEFSIWQRVKRLVYREVLWQRIQKNEKVHRIVRRILEQRHDIPDYVWQFIKNYQTINNELRQKVEKCWWQLLKDASPEMRQNLCALHQTWLYMIYSTPLAYEIADIEEPEKPIVHDVTLELPPSKLVLKGDNVTHQDGEIDYLVIGSGPAGSVIAHELVRQGARVVVIEAGSFVKPLSTITEFDADLMESHNERRSDTGSLIIRNGATVGGGTTVNIDLAFSPQLPAIRHKLNSWVEKGYMPASFLHEAPNDWKHMLEAEAWICQNVHTRKVEKSEINTNNRLLKDGHPQAQTYALNERKPTGKPGEVLKISSCEAFLVPALCGGKAFKGHLSLIPDACVERVLFSQKEGTQHADGVMVQFRPPLDKPNVMKDPCNLKPDPHKMYTIKARHVIVCGGTLGSAELLLRSSINNPHIGHGIVVHPSIGVLGLFPQIIDVHKGLSASVYAPGSGGAYFFESMTANPAFIAMLHPGGGLDIMKTIREYRHLGGFGIMLVDHPINANNVYIDNDTQRVRVHYQLDGAAKQTLRQALKEAVNILFQQGAHEVFIPTAENIYAKGMFTFFTTPAEAHTAIDQLQFLDGLNFVSSAHMQGSNKMGNSPANSVVSQAFKVWDVDAQKEIDNLYVCDSSVFPTSVGANPMQSIYVIAKLFVDRFTHLDNPTQSG